MQDKKLDKIEQFIKKREELKKSPVANKSPSTPVFHDKNPKIKQLNNIPKEAPKVIKGATTKIDTNQVSKLTPKRFKAVQSKLKAESVVKDKINQAIKDGDAEAAKLIAAQVSKVAEKTGDKSLLKELIKRVSKSSLAKKAGKKLLGAIPIVGGAISALASGEVEAAIPGLDMIDSLGPKPGSEDYMIESGNYSPAYIEKLKKQAQERKK